MRPIKLKQLPRGFMKGHIMRGSLVACFGFCCLTNIPNGGLTPAEVLTSNTQAIVYLEVDRRSGEVRR